MTRPRRIALRIGGAAAAVVLSLLVLEAGVRIVLSFDRNYFEERLERPRAAAGAELTLSDIIRAHPDDGVVYELRPGAQGTFVGKPLTINSLGMRDVERSFARPEETVRIVGLGDSHTFGWGVEQDETYLAVLERLLNERFPNRRFEAWNLGVPGYNTVQEVRAFELRADALDPDLVVINYVDNDMDLPNFLADRPNLWTPRRSFLRELVSRRMLALRDGPALPLDLVGVEPDERTGRYLPERVPERYRPLAGADNMEAAFLRLIGIARSRRIPAVVLFNPDDYRAVLLGRTTDARRRGIRELADRLARAGFLVVDPQERIVRYLRDNDLGASALWIRPTDSHTNPLRHRLIAEALFEELVGAGALGPDRNANSPAESHS